MEYETVTLKDKWVEGLEIVTTNSEKGMQQIGALWQTFFATGMMEKMEHPANAYTIGLYTEYEGDHTKPYHFVVGKEVTCPSDSLEDRIVKKIVGGKYARFIVRVDMQQAVSDFWNEIWHMNLDRKYSCDFEEYRGMVEGKQEIHMYISLKE